MTSKEMFTDKAKELFEEWLKNNFAGYKPYSEICISLPNSEIRWNDLPLSMQFGVIEDFAESLDLLIEICTSSDSELNPNGIFEWYISDLNYLQGDYFNKTILNTRNEARIECIKVLNNLINNKDGRNR